MMSDLKTCIEDKAGIIVTKAYCDETYSSSELDNMYDYCYSLIDLWRERKYCELKYIDYTEAKYKCA
jgi:uncharacterized phosphosugar-binding protein